MPNGIRDKRPFLDVAYDGAFSAYATIEKRPVAFLNLWGPEAAAALCDPLALRAAVLL